MRYPVAIESGGDATAYGVAVPDLAGCFSAGDTLDEAIRNVEEAIYAWIEATLDAGGEVPGPSSLDRVAASPEYAGWAIGIVEIDPGALDNTPERVNIILPRRVLRLLDRKAKTSGTSRSGFIAHLALAAD